MLSILLGPICQGVMPTRDIIKAIREHGHTWFNGCYLRVKHGVTTEIEGLFLVRGEELGYVTSVLQLFDDSTVTDFPPPDPAHPELTPDFVIAPIVFSGLEFSKELAIPSKRLATDLPDDSLWFVFYKRRPYTEAYTFFPGSDNNQYPRLIGEVNPTGTVHTWDWFFPGVVGYGYTWEGYIPTLPPVNISPLDGKKDFENILLSLGLVAIQDEACVGTILAPGNVPSITTSIIDYWFYYSTHLRHVSGVALTGLNRKFTTSVPENIIGVFGAAYDLLLAPGPFCTYTSIVGRPVIAGSPYSTNKKIGLPYLIEPGGVGQTAIDEYATAWYNRYKFDPYVMVFTGWVYFPATAEWTSLEYIMDGLGARTTLGYDQFMPAEKDFSMDVQPVYPATAIRFAPWPNGSMRLFEPEAWVYGRWDEAAATLWWINPISGAVCNDRTGTPIPLEAGAPPARGYFQAGVFVDATTYVGIRVGTNSSASGRPMGALMDVQQLPWLDEIWLEATEIVGAVPPKAIRHKGPINDGSGPWYAGPKTIMSIDIYHQTIVYATPWYDAHGHYVGYEETYTGYYAWHSPWGLDDPYYYHGG